MKIFPYIITRIGGGSFDHLAQIDYSPLTAQVHLLLHLQTEKEQKKQQLCNRLFEFIRKLTDPKAQNQIQNVRRDIFNDRSIKTQALANVKLFLSSELIMEVDTYLAFKESILIKMQVAETVYTQLQGQERQHLQKLANDEYLQKGLVLSSQTLLDALPSYTATELVAFRKKEFQREQSVLKYLTRMYTKTSPFSTFNNLTLASLGSPSDTSIHATAATQAGEAVVGHIRLNNYLLQYLKNLFVSNPNIYKHFMLRHNPTINIQEDHYLYLTNYNNTEAFQRIPANAVVDLLFKMVQTHASGIRFSALVEEVCEDVEASQEEIAHYVKQLIDYGFFEFDLGVSGIDPDWDLKLVKRLQHLEEHHTEHISELISTLQHIRTLATEKYGQSTARERVQLLKEAYGAFQTVCMRLHKAAGLPEEERKTQEELQAEWFAKQKETKLKKKENGQAEEAIPVKEKEEDTSAKPNENAFKHASSTYFYFKPEHMFYEDTTRKVSVEFDECKLSNLITKLHILLQEFRPFRGLRSEREQMQQYFVRKYGPATSVNLLTFYEDFYRDVKKPEDERAVQAQKEALIKAKRGSKKDEILPLSKAGEEEVIKETEAAPSPKELKETTQPQQTKLQQWTEKFTEMIRSSLQESLDQIQVNYNLIRQVSQATGLSPTGTTEVHSYGAFIQLYQEKDETGESQLKGVLNAAVSGYGKMISRFLHILPTEVTHTIREWNSGLQGENSLFIEDCDASYFNANLHPPLMPFEIRMPGGHNSLPVEQQMPITDFEVHIQQEGGEIQLLHKPSGKRAYIFDLGFQGHGGRSQLFQLLDKFTQAEYLHIYSVVSAVNAATKTADPTPVSSEQKLESKDIVVCPRIVYENQLVLQRKAWYVPKECIPARQPDMSDWDSYFVINEWRKAHSITDEVFVSINPNRNLFGIDPELMKKLGRDDYKPQYIHFNDPLLVQLFEKLVTKAPSTLKIEEMLPSSQHLLSIENQRFVTEFIVQWNA